MTAYNFLAVAAISGMLAFEAGAATVSVSVTTLTTTGDDRDTVSRTASEGSVSLEKFASYSEPDPEKTDGFADLFTNGFASADLETGRLRARAEMDRESGINSGRNGGSAAVATLIEDIVFVGSGGGLSISGQFYADGVISSTLSDSACAARNTLCANASFFMDVIATNDRGSFRRLDDVFIFRGKGGFNYTRPFQFNFDEDFIKLTFEMTLSANANFRFGGMSVIQSADFGNTAGLLFDELPDLTVTTSSGVDPRAWTRSTPVAPIPVPAALPLLIAALGALTFVGQRRVT